MAKSLVNAILRRESEFAVRTLLDIALASGASLAEITDTERTPLLSLAIRAVTDSSNVVHLLLKYGAVPSTPDKNGQTALHTAASCNNVDALSAMIMMPGIDINIQDKNGDTPLHEAVKHKSIESVEWLLFAGANPNIQNGHHHACNHVIPKNCFQLRVMLREHRLYEPKPYFLTSGVQESITSEDGQMSIALNESQTACTAVIMRTYPPSHPNLHVSWHDGEKPWGHGIEYRSSLETSVIVTFALHNRVDELHELVLRRQEKSEEEQNFLATVEDAVEEDRPGGESQEHFSERKHGTSGQTDQPARVATAVVHVQLHGYGSLVLVYRPRTDTLFLRDGSSSVQSSVNPSVQLQALVPDGGAPLDAVVRMQLEPSPPIEPEELDQGAQLLDDVTVQKDPQAISSAPDTKNEPAKFRHSQILRSMSDFVRVTGSRDVENITGLILNIFLPLPVQFTKEDRLHIYTRELNLKGISPENDMDDEEKEMSHWKKSPETAFASQTSSSITLHTRINEMTTLVQTRPQVREEEIRRQVARQHLKLRLTPVRFYVHGKRAQDENQPYYDLKVEVKAWEERQHCSNAQEPKGYRTVKVSDRLFVQSPTQFCISVQNDALILPNSQNCVVICFQHGIHTHETGNSCGFQIQVTNESEAVSVTLDIEKSKMALKNDKELQWKKFVVLDFRLEPDRPLTDSPAESVTSSPDCSPAENHDEPELPQPRYPEINDPFTDILLLDLAKEIPTYSVTPLGIELFLRIQEVESIMSQSIEPEIKTLKVLHKARMACSGPQKFAKNLFRALRKLQLNSVLNWLLEHLRDWEGIPDISDWEHFRVLPEIHLLSGNKK